MKRAHVAVLATLALAIAHFALQRALADRDVVESLLSPNAGSSIGALLLAATFLASRLALYVVAPVYWAFHGGDALGLALRRRWTRRSAHVATGP